jgi:hypothetical protein
LCFFVLFFFLNQNLLISFIRAALFCIQATNVPLLLKRSHYGIFLV